MVYAMAVVKLLSWICVVITWKSRGVMASKSFFSGELLNRETAILLPCANRPDGRYATANAFRYLECKNGISKFHDCGKGEIFVATCRKCLVQIESQQSSFCQGRVATSSVGRLIRYQNPWNCNTWYECLYGIPNEYRCRGGLSFSPKQQHCVMSAKECKLAYQTAPHSLYLFTGMPSKVDASFLWADGNIMLIDGSTYFKFDKHSGSLLRGFPLTMMDTDLSGIPPNIDAALSLPEQKTYFFKQGKVWQWESNEMPKRISGDWRGIPDDLDSAFYWPYNHKAYFFRGEYFYRYDIVEKKVDYGYPKLIASGWPGASPTIDAATSLKNGTVFLIKKNKVFTFHPPVCKEETTFIDGLKKDLFLSWWHQE